MIAPLVSSSSFCMRVMVSDTYCVVFLFWLNFRFVRPVLPVARGWILFIALQYFLALILFFLLGIHFISIDFIEHIT
jgi:hypothetical protein